MEDLKRLEELSHNAFEYVIVKTGKGGSEDIGYCNSEDNPVEIVRKLNLADESHFYLFTVNNDYNPKDAMEYTSKLIKLTKLTTASVFSSLSNSEFMEAISKF